MSTMLELLDYYANLLIIQYTGKAKAEATIKTQTTPVLMPQTSEQTISFDAAPTEGVFVLSYDGENSASLNWNDSAATIQTALRALTGLSAITVTGAISDLSLVVTFTDVLIPAELLVVESSTLDATITITETDEILPLAVQNAFNLDESNPAIGAQLDILGKYVGVERTSRGFFANITLDDADFLQLIRMAVFRNSAESDLASIQNFLNLFFPGEVFVYDYQTMRLSYFVQESVGSQELVQLFITQGLLPKPMGVLLSLIIYAPIIDMFFGFRTYSLPAYNSTPFNDYADYQTDWPWLSYSDAIFTS